VLNESFSPTAGEVEQARRVIEAADAAQERGLGACEVDGRMVDWPVVERAREIIRMHEAIRAASDRFRQ
jgi:citrate lyase subunit beta/citryl-CoA lyase